MTPLHKVALYNSALSRCTPEFRRAVNIYGAGKPVTEMLRFFCLLDEFSEQGVLEDEGSMDEFVLAAMSANNMSGAYLTSVLDAGFSADASKYNRAWQCWSVLDDIGYLLEIKT